MDIPSNKRNYRTAWEHFQADQWELEDGTKVDNPCKANREAALEKARGEGRVTGRPKGSGTKQQRVVEYFLKHPDATVKRAEDELGFSHTTMCKWRPSKEQLG